MKSNKKVVKKVDRKKTSQDEAVRLINAGKYDQADAILSDLLSSHPGDPEVCRLLATLHLKRGELAVALSEIRFQAMAAIGAQDYELAESLIRDYLQADPTCAALLELLGHMYEQKGDASSAADQYGKAIDLLMDNPDPEDPTRPAELFDKINELVPGSPVARRLASRFEPAPAPQPAEEMVTPTPSPASPVQTKIEVNVQVVHSGPVLPPEPEKREDDERVPFPPVNQMPPGEFRERVAAPELVTAQPAEPLEVEPTEQDERVSFPPVDRMEPVLSAPPAEEVVEPAVPAQPDGSVAAPADPAMPAVPDLMEPEPPPAPAPTETTVASTDQEASVEDAPVPAQSLVPPINEQPAQQPTIMAESMAPGPTGSLGVPSPGTWDAAAQSRAEDRFLVAPSADVQPLPRRRAPKPFGGEEGLSRLLDRCRDAAYAAVRYLAIIAGIGVGIPVAGLGLVALVWLGIEQKPVDEVFNLTKHHPSRTIHDPTKNGYFLLLGFATDAPSDPVKAGLERSQQAASRRSLQCFDHRPDPKAPLRLRAETGALANWFQAPDPVEKFQQEKNRLARWTEQNGMLLHRYRQWLSMAFEDWGYGRLESPDCPQILSAHRLYVADGFSQSLGDGVERVKKDFLAWRGVLTQAKTLPMKVMAATAMNEDAAVLAGLLSRQDLEATMVPTLTQLARPLDQVERSLRWPMQSEFAIEVKRVETGSYKRAADERSFLAGVVARLPLPKQKTLNAHARFYEAASMASYPPNNPLPALSTFAHTPPQSILDYLMNPIDNYLAPGWKPSWEDYADLMLETDARLRLAALLARARGTARANLPGLVAKAGPSFVDPFTGLPMQVNLEQGTLYSVGRDRKDDRGNPAVDISVPIGP